MIKKFDEYVNESFMDKLQIKYLCKKYKIRNYSINDDLSIDVDGDVLFVSNKNIKSLPLKFRNVSGFFDCSHNGLLSLEGSPKNVGGHFNCSRNLLTTLVGSPENVGGGIQFSYNNIYSLEGHPKHIGEKLIYNSYQYNPICEILKIFHEAYTSETDQMAYPISYNKINVKLLLECWDTFSPVYQKDGKWHIINYRLKELYYYVTGKDFTIKKFSRPAMFSRGKWSTLTDFPELKNYTTDES